MASFTKTTISTRIVVSDLIMQKLNDTLFITEGNKIELFT